MGGEAVDNLSSSCLQGSGVIVSDTGPIPSRYAGVGAKLLGGSGLRVRGGEG